MGVSLIIPNCNNAPYLRQCLGSAIEQTLPFEEIIVVDDASDDDSAAVVRSLADDAPSVRLITFERRSGVSVARHVGMEAAQSSHVTTLDSDDFFWSVKKNEREWSIIANAGVMARPVLAFSDIRRVSASGEDFGSVAARRAVREGDVFRWLLDLRGFVPRDFTMSRDAYFAAGGYDPAFDLYEDWDLKLRLARTCEFRFTGNDGVAYRENPHGLSRAPFVKHVGAMYRIVWKNTRDFSQPLRFLVRCHALMRVGWFHRGRLKAIARYRMRSERA